MRATATFSRAEDLRRAWFRLGRSRASLVGLGLILLVFVVVLFGPWLAPYPDHGGAVVDMTKQFQAPSRQHLMGTDQVGRDIFSRLLIGARPSVMMGVLVLAIALAVGVPLGLIAGYFGGRVNAIIMRVTDVVLAFPSLLLALAITAALKPSFTNAMIALAFGFWPWHARLVQGEVLKVKEELFVEASRALGAGPFRIIFREILPNILTPLIVKTTLDLGFAILTGASLGFLGLGAQPPDPEWGTMVAAGRSYLPERWWMTTFPGLAIFVTVLGFNLLGDGLRDVFDVDLDRYSAR